MKKVFYILIALMFVSAMPETASAQSDDPYEQHTLKARDNTTKREKKVSCKKKEEQQAPAATKTQKTPENNEMTISNPCDEWLDFELVSVVGGKGTQTVKITGRFINHDLNKEIQVGHNLLAYDNDGVEHNGWTYSYSDSFKTITDVPVKFVIEIPGKINPSTTKVLPVVSFDIDECRIEMRNVTINWK